VSELRKRREFIMLLGGVAVAWPLAASTQQGERMRRIGFWVGEPDTDPNAQRRVTAFKQGLAELGWIEGRTVQIEYRWPIIDGEQVRADAESLIALAPDVIVTTGAPTVAVFKRLTRTIPIVFTFVTDPVRDGLVETLAHPGGNITGFTIFEHTMAGKWVEMLKEVAPGVTRVAVMQNPEHPAWTTYLSAITGVASSAGVAVTPLPVHDADEIRRAIADFVDAPNGGLIVLPSGVAAFYRDLIVAATGRHRLPAIFPERIFTEAGGLISYGVVLSEMYRQAARYADRILRGAKPSELPVQAATKFEMIINLKTAKALGLDVPPTLLARADEVIE
jgi:putative tryptophan/tyrosine transport system substrate-binding protein